MSKATRATQALDRAGIAYSVHAYAYDPEAPRIGLQAAEALGIPPDRILKTLMAEADGKPVCVLVASDREISLKRLAAACGAKTAAMLKPAEAERITGYHVGGISPLGQKRRLPVVIDAAALAAGHAEIYVNGGGRGLQVRLKPSDLVALLSAQAAPLT
ncbi:Cys-tRNA(Pro) deacylase [Methylobacterium oxalidis]|uniref:Cys-tRNA(Pro)/Cys-tRNA(Cys) deacylase n=1 Tax=Methylobacterium oxalidis TaxID=944322 RepID=A0A512IYR7_9HYPH|nr:Cys-tRNA(Pro) deacylase [Methylobacterium oxalidis]GEP02857.1 Cys-tRNA(Pro)/Cys-tRNA(Cys) deacylase [Methylobacterium oxalidis]GJE32660.1 Cys-tRNA(Pro)/Cys-tRNA(Cys) deacylase YbaK [Methylobacterium oxalidis]GLS66742.1 Cys-tRNA(Pro)/Cys-tRNA(Cys) deacylase [Methylobacterium oxalidis]